MSIARFAGIIDRSFLPAAAILLALALIQAGAGILISLEYKRLAAEIAAGFSHANAPASILKTDRGNNDRR